MKINKFNKKPLFPLTYGDQVENDDVRLSNYVVALMKSKKFQNYTTALFFALLSLGSYAQPSSAIPAEYGEAANEMLNQVAQGAEQVVPDLGQVAGNVNLNGANVPPHNPIPNNLNGVGQGGRVGFQNQQNFNGQQNFGNPNPPHTPAWRLPGPPMTPTGQYINTAAIIGSVGWICLNASWGNPILAYGCIGVVGGLLNVLRKRFF